MELKIGMQVCLNGVGYCDSQIQIFNAKKQNQQMNKDRNVGLFIWWQGDLYEVLWVVQCL